MRNVLGKTVAKANLPVKMCIVCVRPFTWRKKWERTWDDRETCSTRCLGEARLRRRPVAGGSGAVGVAPPTSDAVGAEEGGKGCQQNAGRRDLY